MKKLLLTVAVASLAMTSNSFAVGGKDSKEDARRTETEKREEAKKVGKEVGSAGATANNARAESAANQLLLKTRVESGTALTVAEKRLAEAVTAGILELKDLEKLEQNSGKDVAVNYTKLLSTAARKNLLRKDSNNAEIGTQAAGLAKFGRIEVVNNIDGKTSWTPEAEAKLNTTLIEAARVIDQGDATKAVDALVMGLKKAGFSEERIKEILKECFGILA